MPHTVIRPIAELLENDTLTVLAANDTPMPYVGWIEVSFQLDNEKNRLQVPILVSSDPAMASDPIIGYYVIEAVINKEAITRGEQKHLAHKVSKAFSITMKTAQNVVKLVQQGFDPDTGVKRVVLPANQVSTIYIRAHVNAQAQGLDMMFSPDMLNPPPEGVSLSEVLVRIPERKVKYIPVPITNMTDHTVYLNRHKVIGHLGTVKTVYSAGLQPKENNQKDTLTRKQPADTRVERPKVWDPPVDLSHLPENQHEAAKTGRM